MAIRFKIFMNNTAKPHYSTQSLGGEHLVWKFYNNLRNGFPNKKITDCSLANLFSRMRNIAN